MKHSIKIKMRGCSQRDGPILECTERPVASWLWRLLFGNRHKVVILMPGNCVDSVNVYELPEGGGVT